MEYSVSRQGSNLAIGIGIGAMIGLAAGMLLAPKSGRETMEDLKSTATNTARTIKSTVRGKAEILQNSMQDMADKTENAIKDVQRDM